MFPQPEADFNNLRKHPNILAALMSLVPIMQKSNSINHFKHQRSTSCGKGHECKLISTSKWVEFGEKKIDENAFSSKHLDKQGLN